MAGGAGLLVGGRYLLLEPAGEGGMGRVWRSRDQLLDREVAVKEVLLAQQRPAAERAYLVARTMREARAVARLDHPGVITIHDVVEHDGVPWIVMQFVSGPSLGAEIARHGALPWQRVGQIGEQVADALAHAHAAGIVHRDLKPDNILLSARRAIVTDFGIAHVADSSTKLTSTGTVIGTPHYMAPEQLEGAAAGPPADMWALGATLYAAVEGAPPFDAPTLTAVITAILTKDLPVPPHAGPLTGVLRALLDKDPGRRPDAQAATLDLAARSAGPVSDAQPAVPAAPAMPVADHPATVPASAADTAEPAVATDHPAALSGSATGGATITGQVPLVPASVRVPSPQQPLPARRTRPRLLWLAASMTAILAIAVAVPLALTLPGAPRAPSRTAAKIPAAKTSPLPGPHPRDLAATLTDPDGASVASVAFGPGGTLAADSQFGSIYLWDTATRKVTATLTDPGTEGVYSVAFGPHGTLAAADGNGSVYVWDTATRKVTATLTTPGGGTAYAEGAQSPGPHSVAFGPGGTLAVASNTGSVYLWDTTTKTITATLTVPGPDELLSVAFGPGDALAATGGTWGNGSFHTYLWDTATKTITATLSAPGIQGVSSVAFGPGSILAAADDNGTIDLWDTATEKMTAALTAPGNEEVSSVAFGPSGILAAADYSGSTYLWDTATKKMTATLTAPGSETVNSIAFGPGGTLAAGDENGSTYLWQLTKRNP